MAERNDDNEALATSQDNWPATSDSWEHFMLHLTIPDFDAGVTSLDNSEFLQTNNVYGMTNPPQPDTLLSSEALQLPATNVTSAPGIYHPSYHTTSYHTIEPSQLWDFESLPRVSTNYPLEDGVPVSNPQMRSLVAANAAISSHLLSNHYQRPWQEASFHIANEPNPLLDVPNSYSLGFVGLQSEASLVPINYTSSSFVDHPAQSPHSRPLIVGDSSGLLPAKQSKDPRPKRVRKSEATRRSGPLDNGTRRKTDNMRDVGACWRCKKYRKACNGISGVCDSCQVPGFRVWPSEIGCRRERLESLVLFLLPGTMEQELLRLPHGWMKSKSWREIGQLPLSKTDEGVVRQIEGIHDPWTLSKLEARSTRLFNTDYAELADIAARYQDTRTKPIPALEASCTLFINTCRLYQCFVQSPPPSTDIKPHEMLSCVTAVRNSLRKSFTQVQKLFLSTKRTDWFPAFLSATLLTCAAIVFVDTAIAVPSPVREFIWGDFRVTRSSLRQGGYQLLVDLVRASTNGVNPFRQLCWRSHTSTGSSDTMELRASGDRYTLLGVDTAALEGLLALSAWQVKYQPDLEAGRIMIDNDSRISRIMPIAGVCKMFDF